MHPFHSHQIFHNLLPCSPIPIGPYGPKNPSGSSSEFQNLAPIGIVQTATFPILVILLTSSKLLQIGNMVNLTKPHPSNLSMHALIGAIRD
jgi:hypothetical protein